MPNAMIKSFSKKTGKSVKDIEKLWDQAKEIVKNEYKGKVKPDTPQFYALVVSILKKQLKIKKSNSESFEGLLHSLKLI